MAIPLSYSLVIDSGFEWKEPHPRQRFVLGPPATGHKRPDDDDSDYNGIHDDDQPLDFHIDCNSCGEAIAATSLYGDELTITLSDGDASTVRGVIVPAHPLMNLSNFLGLRSAAPPRSIVTQDSSITIRQTIGSRSSNITDDVGLSRLSRATTASLSYDNDFYRWEAELVHRKSNSCSVATSLPSFIDDLARSVNNKNHSNSSSSTTSVVSMSSGRGEAIGRRRRDGQTRRRSFFHRMFSGNRRGYHSGKNSHVPDLLSPPSTAAVPTVASPSTVGRFRYRRHL
ncbi:hypothetical protein SPBR_09237 [Sporothrix brasiliensis 5110]|uniref:Uncharacterized protein n=1 Tax=Sporothrix brasiliensis 5110 TaxID=1398154 RepID=A0A0C2J0T0_9PEZI|nr:uncharacterized protein SPBR_09237 [Sporothrix brasiliensis 5110]KIH95001.1 hypothetical protein SPBR_09237 [Sporothrix brasiliensis 5110]